MATTAVQAVEKNITSDLGIKESTSASQYFRAKNLLAKMIQEYSKTTTI